MRRLLDEFTDPFVARSSARRRRDGPRCVPLVLPPQVGAAALFRDKLGYDTLPCGAGGAPRAASAALAGGRRAPQGAYDAHVHRAVEEDMLERRRSARIPAQILIERGAPATACRCVPKDETRVEEVKEVFALSCAGVLDEYEEGIGAALRELPVGDGRAGRCRYSEVVRLP